MEESRQIHRIRNAILDYIINQSQQIIAIQKVATHPALCSIMESAGLHSPIEEEVDVYREEQQKRLLNTA